MDGVIENRSPFSSRSCAQYRITLRQPVLTAFTFVPITISTSWDASKIALIAESKQLMEETFRVFTHKTSPSPPDKATAESPASLIPVENDQLFKEPSVLCGYGKFHITATEDRDAEDELFIACNGMSVDIYRVQGRWSRIRTIELSPSDSIPDPRRLIEGLRARYFAWSDKTDVVSVCDLESGLLVCCMTLHNGSVKFSDDGSLMALRQAGDIVSTRWTECGTLLNSTDVSRILHPTFLQGNAQIIIPLVAPDEEYGRGQIGMLMDTTSVSTVDRISVPARCFEQQFLTAGARRQFLYSVHGSKLDCTNIKQHVIQPYLQPRYACDNYCFDELSKLPRVDILSTAECAGTFISSSGLKFTVEFRTARTKNWRNGIELQCLVVWISDSAGQLREAVSIPPAEIGNIAGNWLEYRAYFDAVNQQMIVYSNLYVMVWALPITLDGDFELLLTWWTQTAPFQTTDRVDWCWSELARCSHQQLYLKVCNVDDNCEDVAFDIVRLRCDDVFGSEPARFLDGILVLIEMFEASEDEFKPHILKYIGRYLNCHPDKENRSQNIMNKICQHVTQENHVAYGKFLKGLLESSYGRWVPRPDLDENTNPVWLFVNLAKNMPRAISLAQIVIDYCIGMAKKEMDPHFLLPIMGPLQELIRQQDLHTDVALGTLQKLAFIPTMERSYVIDHAIIAQPPEFRWRFWKNNARPLYECDNPVMKLDRNPKIKPHDPLNDNFTRDLFVASFDMLWRAPEAKPDTRSSTARIKSSTRVPQSWVRTLFHIILLNCKLKSDITVECHNFALESMDNPAIAALVEYKWNTIGYSYWLFRFLWQCFYYLLVLVAVFMQVYSDQQESLFGVFIAIIVLAAIFLWLELLQAIHSPSRYFASPYNFVDMVVFALPLAGSICQIINIINDDQTGNTNTLSFSVLFIFLHFLFELRIIKSVCHFVTIIIRIMGEIRVFFVVFAGGILAFTIAILHLLRACTVGTCDTSEVQFPSNFYGAISSTYFFMGGIWDPVSDLFAGDNWAFHTMMIIYFFFTTILLLNVLIALINVAFSAGDEAWLLVWTDNRLRYVESAENLTYHIPGFREAHDWFPKEIYYSATLQEVKDYRNKYFKKNGEDSSRREVTNQRMFGQTLPAKKVAATAAASASAPLARRGSNASAETSLDQQQVIQDLKKVLVEVLGKTDKRVEVLEAQLTEMKQMLSKFCKEP
ncbi:hypothetical protein EDD21DRAFT_108105 [Dissophora ornata]|nr:hypothetical protein EDD21DRAFT_108105 [Dissophora ornata]